MRLICACGFFRDIAALDTKGQARFTCAKCVAEIERSREVAKKIEKEKALQQRVAVVKHETDKAQPGRTSTESNPKRKRRFSSRKEMLAYIQAGLAGMGK
jgi:DNA-directed RNA polymerase subunit M/transcription elongation factor TFIIS